MTIETQNHRTQRASGESQAQGKILIVGAGPTGLMVACHLAHWGVGFRIIDGKVGPIEDTRALGIHARSMHNLRNLGLAEDFARDGLPTRAFTVISDGTPMGRLPLEEMGEGMTPYNYLLLLAQCDTEKKLLSYLAARGIGVEWGTQLETLVIERDRAFVRLQGEGQVPEEAVFDWIVGADGAQSAVRKSAGITFAGGTHEASFFVLDATVYWDEKPAPFDTPVALAWGTTGLAAMFRVPPQDRRYRIIGLIPDGSERFTAEQAMDQVRAVLQRDMVFDRLQGFNPYRIHHLAAQHFRKGPILLAGDAGHVHSPLGGQGMNTGLQDAQNLAWKLASVAQGRTSQALLDSYHDERFPFAMALTQSTDKSFQFIAADNTRSVLLRRYAAPVVFKALAKIGPLKRKAFWQLSQLGVRYTQSPLTQGLYYQRKDLVPGQCPPWFVFRDIQGETFDILDVGRTPGFHLMIFTDEAEQSAAWRTLLSTFRLPVTLHIGLPDDAKRAKAWEGAWALIRPDGHLGIMGDIDDLTRRLPPYFRETLHDYGRPTPPDVVQHRSDAERRAA